ncbi:hypothetical protein QQF64_015028 [Cirrhinus molitorella]|uniref:Uncharacterized protein n=1 Tax=Cirrhinus molitorella TaxID=172907 RepID=A0ABR3NTS5_9TELE
MVLAPPSLSSTRNYRHTVSPGSLISPGLPWTDVDLPVPSALPSPLAPSSSLVPPASPLSSRFWRAGVRQSSAPTLTKNT